MRYAQARAEVAMLAQQNEQLQADLGAMVDLKLQLAEARAALQAAYKLLTNCSLTTYPYY